MNLPNDRLRGETIITKVAKGEFINGSNIGNPEVLDHRAQAILTVADARFARLAGAFVAEVDIPERHIPKAHRVLDALTKNL